MTLFAPRMPMLAAAGAALFAGLSLATPAAAQTETGTRVGSLICDVSSGIGLFVVQKQTMTCQYKPLQGDATASYTGKIETYGITLGGVEKGHLVWAVVAQLSEAPSAGALAGKYVGASADAAFVAGLGANVLVGGSDQAFALQPISVEGEIGVNVAAGVTELTLVAAP
jgi:hypothetical protein